MTGQRSRSTSPQKSKPFDALGRRLRIGDWVRLVRMPDLGPAYPKESRAIFRKALGKTFRVDAFDEFGHAELNLSKKVEWGNWIWVEPPCLRISRRRRK